MNTQFLNVPRLNVTPNNEVKKAEDDGESLLHVIKTTVLEVRNRNERRTTTYFSPHTCASFLPYFWIQKRYFDVVVLPIVSTLAVTIILILDYMCIPCIVFFPPFLASLPLYHQCMWLCLYGVWLQVAYIMQPTVDYS